MSEHQPDSPRHARSATGRHACAEAAFPGHLKMRRAWQAGRHRLMVPHLAHERAVLGSNPRVAGNITKPCPGAAMTSGGIRQH